MFKICSFLPGSSKQLGCLKGLHLMQVYFLLCLSSHFLDACTCFERFTARSGWNKVTKSAPVHIRTMLMVVLTHLWQCWRGFESHMYAFARVERPTWYFRRQIPRILASNWCMNTTCVSAALMIQHEVVHIRTTPVDPRHLSRTWNWINRSSVEFNKNVNFQTWNPLLLWGAMDDFEWKVRVKETTNARQQILDSAKRERDSRNHTKKVAQSVLVFQKHWRGRACRKRSQKGVRTRTKYRA